MIMFILTCVGVYVGYELIQDINNYEVNSKSTHNSLTKNLTNCLNKSSDKISNKLANLIEANKINPLTTPIQKLNKYTKIK